MTHDEKQRETMMDNEAFELALLDWGQLLELVVVTQGMVTELARVIESERVYPVKGIVRALASPVAKEALGVAQTSGISVRMRASDLPACDAEEVLIVRWLGERYRVTRVQHGESVVVLEGRRQGAS